MNIHIEDQVFEKYNDLYYGFIVSKSCAYSTDIEKSTHSARLISELLQSHQNLENLETHKFNELYSIYYKNMGLKVKSMSTPVKQAIRVMSLGQYRGILPIIDCAMRIEYSSLISFQVFDFEKINGNLTLSFSDGNETLCNFHGEEKICKTGELLILDEDGAINSSYYGNSKHKMLTEDSKYSLTRIMKIPGISNEVFTSVMTEFCTQTNSIASLVLSNNNRIGMIQV